MLTSSQVLLLGDADDPHSIAVRRELEKLGVTSFVYNIWNENPNEFPAMRLNDRALSQFDGVWTRLKPRSGGLTPKDAFVLRERKEYLYGLVDLCSVPSRRINDPWAQERARNKIVQLRLAHKVGFVTPSTIVTNNVDALSEYFYDQEELVYKPLTWLSSINGELLFANKLKVGDICSHRNAIYAVPGLFQSYVGKSCEYRTTIVDSSVFHVRIYSQEHQRAKIDWRRAQDDLRYELVPASKELAEKMLNFMKELGLRFAAFDFIEDVNGEMVFLEANPAGNWLWLEERLGIAVAAQIAKALISD